MRFLRFFADGREQFGFASHGRIGDLTSLVKSFGDLLPCERQAGLRAIIAEMETRYSEEEVAFLPALPETGRIFCVGVNYAKIHPVSGAATETPVQPLIFLKTREALVGHGEPIDYPEGISDRLDYEGELAIVIGRPGRHIAEADALSHIAGYTILNDGSVRDWQKHSLMSGKNFFRSGSCGPWIVTADEIADPAALTLVTRVNGDEVQRTGIDAMMFSVPQIVSHISRFTPLGVGDIIATGSPAGSGASLDPPRFLKPGDRVEIDISGIGRLANEVR